MANNTVHEYDVKILALAAFLECDPAFVEPIDDNEIFGDGSTEYLVLTDDEADEKTLEYIKDSLWAFNSSFLESQTGIPSEMFEIAQDKCEGANDAFLQIVEQSCGLQDFADEAVRADGRGHFLSSYDGEEVEQGDFFIYRVN